MHRLIPLTALLLALSACGLQQPATEQAAVEKPVTQHARAEKTSVVKPTPHIAMENLAPQFLYLAAQDAIKDGKGALAIELLTALVKKDPAATGPHIQLTALLLESGQSKLAQTHLSQLLQSTSLQSGQREELQLLQANLYLVQGHTEQALLAINRFLKKHPVHIQARDIQARIFDADKHYDAGLAAIGEAIRIEELPAFLLLQTQLQLKKGDVAAAKRSLRRMRKLAPQDETPVLMLSSMAVKEKQAEKAEQLLRDFLTANPDAMRARLALGALLVQEKRLLDAILVYRDIASRSGHSPDVLRQLGMLYFQHKDYAEAVSTFRQLGEAQADDLSLFYLAASLEALEKEDEAKAVYGRIHQHAELKTAAQIRLSAIDLQHEAVKPALQRLQAILKQQPRHLEANLMLSSIRLVQEQYRRLLDETEPLVGVEKLPPRLLFNRAVAFDHFKQYERVESTLHRILKHSPNYAEALNFLGYTYAVQGINLEQAEALIQRALIQKPDDGYYLDSLAWTQYKRGEYEQAAKTQAKALQQVPDDAVMYEHYGDIQWMNGDKQAARQAWKQAIVLNSELGKALRHKIKHGL